MSDLRAALDRMREFAEHERGCIFKEDLSGVNGDELAGSNARRCNCGFDDALALYDAALASEPPATGLDVERLAQALFCVMDYKSTATATATGFVPTQADVPYRTHALANAVAAEYARLTGAAE